MWPVNPCPLSGVENDAVSWIWLPDAALIAAPGLLVVHAYLLPPLISPRPVGAFGVE